MATHMKQEGENRKDCEMNEGGGGDWRLRQGYNEQSFTVIGKQTFLHSEENIKMEEEEGFQQDMDPQNFLHQSLEEMNTEADKQGRNRDEDRHKETVKKPSSLPHSSMLRHTSTDRKEQKIPKKKDEDGPSTSQREPTDRSFTVIGQETFLHTEENIKSEEEENMSRAGCSKSSVQPTPNEEHEKPGISESFRIEIGDEHREALHSSDINEAVIAFLKICAKRNVLDENNRCLLHTAAAFGYQDVVLLLLGEDCDKNARDNGSKTALHVASQRGHAHVVEILLKAGADKDPRDREWKTPLHYAAQGGYRTILEILVKYGVDVNGIDKDGKSSLHIAAENGCHLVVKFLLSCGTSPDLSCGRGFSPLQYAISRGHKNVYSTLVEYGALPGDERSRCSLALLAIRSNQLGLLREMLTSDLVQNIEDQCWGEVLKAAYAEGRQDAASMLLERGCKFV